MSMQFRVTRRIYLFVQREPLQAILSKTRKSCQRVVVFGCTRATTVTALLPSAAARSLSLHSLCLFSSSASSLSSGCPRTHAHTHMLLAAAGTARHSASGTKPRTSAWRSWSGSRRTAATCRICAFAHRPTVWGACGLCCLCMFGCMCPWACVHAACLHRLASRLCGACCSLLILA